MAWNDDSDNRVLPQTELKNCRLEPNDGIPRLVADVMETATINVTIPAEQWQGMQESFWWIQLEKNPSCAATKMAFADWLRETNGDDDLAFALEWCARRGKWPKMIYGRWMWYESTPDTPDDHSSLPPPIMRLSHQVGILSFKEAIEILSILLREMKDAIALPES